MSQSKITLAMGTCVVALVLPLAQGCRSTPPPQRSLPATRVTLPPLNVKEGQPQFASSECRDTLPARTESIFVSDVSVIDDASRNLLQEPCVIELLGVDNQGRSVMQQSAIAEFVTEEGSVVQLRAIFDPIAKPGHYKVRLVMGIAPRVSSDVRLVVQ
jgi:hypothetical protein